MYDQSSFSGCHLRISVKSCRMLLPSSALCRGINGRSWVQGQDDNEREPEERRCRWNEGMPLTELHASEGPGSGLSPASLLQWVAAPKLKDVSFIFLSKKEYLFAGTLPSWDSFPVPWTPFWGSRASLARAAGASPVFAMRSSPHFLSCPPPACSVRRGEGVLLAPCGL